MLGYQKSSWRSKEIQHFADQQLNQVILLPKMRVNIVISMNNQVITPNSA
jgi:hypothetical protein